MHLRRAQTTAQEIFNYLSVTLNKIKSIDNELKTKILLEVSDMKNVIQFEVQNVSEILGLIEYKNNKLQQISQIIWQKINLLQNPPPDKCLGVSKKICSLNVKAGFSTGIHEILWCLVSAYYQNQTVILIPKWSRYLDQNQTDLGHNLTELFGNILNFSIHTSVHWSDIYKPLSDSCDYQSLPAHLIKEPLRINTLLARALINKLPRQFGAELIKLIDNPISWWHGQFVAYITRPQVKLEHFLSTFKQHINYTNPIVSIHIRRSDKVSGYRWEAKFHSIDDYMMHVRDYFDKLALVNNVINRVVYVATDDINVLNQLRLNYPEYKFIGNTVTIKLAANQSTRYSTESLWGILADIYILSESDYIVCTFSSAVCRLAYELMRYKRLDASHSYRSLDVPYHYNYGLSPIRTALYNHWPKSAEQWSLRVGDSLHERRTKYLANDWHRQAMNGRGWDTYFYASNTSMIDSKLYQLYPSYKVYDNIDLV